MKKAIPVYLLSGFLGSGKTTLLNELLDYCKESGLKPAVIMNEVGDIDVDGQFVDSEIPMAEMLSGCICCTIRGDLGMTLFDLCNEHRPDIIFIESTGVALPMEVIDSITEGSLLTEVELRLIVTIIDAPYLLELNRSGKGRTLRLMEEQIRCAGWLMLNKLDKVSSQDLLDAEQIIRTLNPHAPIRATVQCKGSLDFMNASVEPYVLLQSANRVPTRFDHKYMHEHGDDHDHVHGDVQSSGCGHGHHHENHDHEGASHHHSYDHVMVYTHYFETPLDREQFERLIRLLPKEVYRAKGILRFTGEDQPCLFQYAYRELEILKIRPRRAMPDVAVFIGENFSKERVAAAIEKMLPA